MQLEVEDAGWALCSRLVQPRSHPHPRKAFQGVNNSIKPTDSVYMMVNLSVATKVPRRTTVCELQANGDSQKVNQHLNPEMISGDPGHIRSESLMELFILNLIDPKTGMR